MLVKKLRARVATPVFAVVGLVSCSSGGPEPTVRLATEVALLKATGEALIAQRQAEVDSWNQERSKTWRIVDTLEMPSGQILDFVDYESIYGEPWDPSILPPDVTSKAHFSANGELVADTKSMVSALPARTEYDELGIVAPPGTLPMPRMTMDAYIHGDHDARSLHEYLQAYVTTPLPAYDASKKLYTAKRDGRTHVSSAGEVSTWNYASVNNDEMSLMQASSLCSGTSPATTMEAIEVGFEKQYPFYSDSNVHLFTYFRTAGGSQGNLVGGQDETVTGFRRNPSSTFFPAATLSTFSAVNGTHRYCYVETQYNAGNWWVNVCGQWIGYYPTQNSASAGKITFDLMGSNACESLWYGEYWDPSVPQANWSNGDIGSGQFANNGQSAWIRETRLGLTSITDVSNFNGTNDTWGYDPDCYSLSGNLTDANGRPFFRMGGPGGNGASCS